MNNLQFDVRGNTDHKSQRNRDFTLCEFLQDLNHVTSQPFSQLWAYANLKYFCVCDRDRDLGARRIGSAGKGTRRQA